MRYLSMSFLLLFLYPVYCFSQAKTDPSFLKNNKHYKEVAKKTKQLEKTLQKAKIQKEDISAQEEALRDDEEETPAAEETQEQPVEKDEAIAETEAEPQKYSALLISVDVAGKMQLMRAKDEYGRTLNLVSSPSIGGRLNFGYRFNKYAAVIAGYSIDKIGYDNFDTFTVAQDKGYTMGGRLGARFYFTERFNIELLASIEQHYIVYTSSPTTTNIDRFNHGAVILGINYIIVQTANFLFGGRTDLKLTLPVSKTLWKTDIGLGVGTELRFGVPVGDKSSFYMNLGAEYINLKPTIVRQYGVTGFVGVGFNLEIH